MGEFPSGLEGKEKKLGFSTTKELLQRQRELPKARRFGRSMLSRRFEDART